MTRSGHIPLRPGVATTGSVAMRRRDSSIGVLGRHAGLVQVGVDVLAWCLALFVALSVRYDFENGWHEFLGLARVLPLVLISQVAIGYHVGLYQRRWRFGSFEEVQALAGTALVTTSLVTLIDATYLEHAVPVSVPLGAGFVVLVGMLGPRYLWRMAIDQRLKMSDPRHVSDRVDEAGHAGGVVGAAAAHGERDEIVHQRLR